MTTQRAEVERELQRVVDRLNSMPLTKATLANADVHACAQILMREGRGLGIPIPAGAELPDLQPQGFGSMVAVLGGDCLHAAAEGADLAPLLEALITLRRSLP